MEIVTLTVKKRDEKQRIDKLLVTYFPHLTRTRIQTLIDEKKLFCCDKIIPLASHKVRAGEIYTLTIPTPENAIPLAENIPLAILYEDADLLVLNKPAGMVVHPAPGHHQSTLVNALLAHCKESLSGIGGVRRPGIVHRLDKDTSGLMVIAKNDKSHHHLCKQFASRTSSRSYHAVVWGVPHPAQGTIEGAIGRSFRNRQKMAVTTKGGKPAITHYHVLKYSFVKGDISQGVALIQCDLKTGRTHQIRVHMAHIDHPLLGDPLYGHTPKWARKTFDPYVIAFPRQALHAFRLTFIHPRTEEKLTFEAPLPSDMEDLLSLL